MQKIKSLNWSGLLSIIKCCLIGIVATLIGVVIFAFVLKFADLPTTFISYINDVIKAFGIFIMVMCLKKSNTEKLLIKAVFAGLIYSLLSFIIFSVLNGNFVLNISFLYDLLFAVIVAVISAVIINVLKHKTV